jgi:hypothetical protein
MRTYQGLITKLKPNQIFVFGSNPQGRHGKGAALTAWKKFGAKIGQGSGLMGQSWGIITKDLRKLYTPSVSKDNIIFGILNMYYFAELNPHLEFLIAYSGHGYNLNGYTPKQMAEMFVSAGPIPDNVVFEETFSFLMEETATNN